MSKEKGTATKAVPRTENWHGRIVVDRHAWLENKKDPAVLAWAREQNTRAERFLSPNRDAFTERLRQNFRIGSIECPFTIGDTTFQWKRNPDQDQPVLYATTPEQSERVIINTDRDSYKRVLTQLDAYGHLDHIATSTDGKYLAYIVTDNGTFRGHIRVHDVASDKIADEVPDVFGYGIVFLNNASGFLYSQYPDLGTAKPGEDPHPQILFHKIGQPWNEDRVFYQGESLEKFVKVYLSSDEKWVIVCDTDGGSKGKSNEIFITPAKEPTDSNDSRPEMRPVFVDHEDAHALVTVYRDYVYVQTDLDTNFGKLMRVSLNEHNLSDTTQWEEVLGEEDGRVLDNFKIIGGKLVLHYLDNAGCSQLDIADLDGTNRQKISLPDFVNVTNFYGSADKPEMSYSYESYTIPPTICEANVDTLSQQETDQLQIVTDLSDVVTTKVSYESKDGIPVSMLYIGKKETSPKQYILTGYGAYGMSTKPTFNPATAAWIAEGGGLAVTNIRGGGEQGEKWHQTGRLGSKQNSFDDFIAAAEKLIADGKTTPEKLAIYGASAGGLLVLAAMIQRPDLFKAVIADVPLADMLNFQKSPIGQMETVQFGNPLNNPSDFEYLFKYSPYHNIQKDTTYPYVLINGGANDRNAIPMHQRKMTAGLQEVGAHALLVTDFSGGHALPPLKELTEKWSNFFSFLDKTLAK